ncbi:endo-1,4-beta-xylanase [Caulobacter sp. 1776]|uniref:endo-1,4-beta-xylanase n=1 Tax=Caulobacter sp. 1776 TaxID=3156420 RepID=UPI003397261E
MTRKFALTRRSAIASALALSACGREAAGQTPDTTPLKSIASTPVGACVQHAFLQDPAFAELFARHYSQLTPEWEMKMEYILQDDGSFRFDRPDAIAEFARRNGIRLYGTTLVWYDQAMPAFLKLDGQGKRFADAYRNYILAVAGRYRGQAVGWDVVNEAVADNGVELRQSIWTRNLGVDEHMVLAFHHAKEADPNAVLFVNEYHLENNPTKRATFMRMVERLLEAGAPIGGIGTQSHLDLDFTRPGMARAAMRDLASFGLPIHVSELDISLGEKPDFSRLPDLLQRQADLTRELAEVYMALPREQRFAFTVWGLRDRDSWLRGQSGQRPTDQGLPLDDAGRPKPMFQALADVLSG